MTYIGVEPAAGYASTSKQTITGNGGTSYTLDHAVSNENEIEVFVNNVRQEPSVAYTVSGTALTMTGNVESSDDFYVVFQGKAIQTATHPEGQDLKAREGTFSGDVTVDTDTLYVDSTNDRVGVNTSSPARDLEVTGGASGLVRVSGSTNGGAIECWDGTNGIYFGSNPVITGTGNSGDLAVYTDTGKAQTYWTGGSERMRISNNGIVTKAVQPAFYANKSVAFSTSSTDIVFDTVRTNVGSHYSGSNGKFTAPVDGTYFFSFGALINTPNTSSYASMRLAIDGTGQAAYITHTSYNSTRNYEPLSWSGVVDLDAGDEVTVWGYFSGGSNTYAGSSYTYFSGYLIG